MTIRRRRALSLFGTLVVAGAMLASPQGAGADPRPSTPISAAQSSADESRAVVTRVPRAQAKKAQGYWTARRMSNAKPMDMRSAGGGKAVTPAPATKSTGLGKIATGTAAARVAASADYWRYSYTAMPAKPIGRIFFRTYNSSDGWYDSSCSGTVIQAENKATVWTAAHCLYNTTYNLWNTNIAFCPGYRDSNGGAPWQAADCQLGVWTLKYHSVPSGWMNSACANGGCTDAEYQYDFGAMVMRPYGTGTTLIQNHTGSHILRYNTTTGAHYSFGYPAERPTFDGRWLYYCYGDIWSSHSHLQMQCNANGGHSGGPWLGPWNSTSGRSYLDSVNSHSWRTDGYMHGVYQGAIAQNLYNQVRNLSAF